MKYFKICIVFFIINGIMLFGYSGFICSGATWTKNNVVVTAPWTEEYFLTSGPNGMLEARRVWLNNYYQVFESSPWTIASGSLEYGTPLNDTRLLFSPGLYANPVNSGVNGPSVPRYKGSSVKITREGITKVVFFQCNISIVLGWSPPQYSWSSKQETLVYIDRSKPTMKLINVRNGYISGSRFKINASDTLSGVAEVSFSNNSDPDAYVSCISGEDYPGGPKYYYVNIPQGTNKINGSIRCVDNAGNVSLMEVSYDVDSESPVIKSLNVDADWNLEDTLKLNIKDNFSGVESVRYSFDKSSWVSIQPDSDDNYSIKIPKEKIGNSILYMQAQDIAGNLREAEFDFVNPMMEKVELFNGKKLETLYDGENQWSGTSVRVCFTVADNNSGLGDVWYKKGNSSEWIRLQEEYKGKKTWNFDVTINKNEFGEKYEGTIDVKIRDVEGNYIIKSLPVKVDGGNPSVSLISSGKEDQWSTESVTLKVDVQDKETEVQLIEYIVENNGVIIESGKGDCVTVTKEGVNKITFTAYDLAENFAIVSTEARIDKTGPEVTTASTIYEGQWASSAVVTAKAEDLYNGVVDGSMRYIIYSDNGEKISEGYGSSVKIDNSGIMKIEFLVEDHLGNIGSKVTTVRVDTGAPTLKVNAELWDGDGKIIEEKIIENENLSTNMPKVFLELIASDDLSGVKAISYRINNETDYKTGNRIEISTEGKSILEFKVEDNAGNTTRVVKTINMDTKKPVIKINESYWSNKDFVLVQIREEDTKDDGSGVDFDSLEYRIGEDGGWIKGDIAKVNQMSTNKVYFRVKDFIGNMGEVWTIAGVDKVLPKAVITYMPEEIDGREWTNLKDVVAHIEFVDEGGAGLKESSYSLDDGVTWINIDGDKVEVPIRKDGENVIHYRSLDGAGNILNGNTRIVLDFEAPKIETEISNQGVNKGKWTNKAGVRLFAKAWDNLSGIDETTWEFAAENGSLIKGKGNEIVVDKEGVNVVSFLVSDRAGNRGTGETEILIDLSEPQIKELVLENNNVNEKIIIKSMVFEDIISGVDKVLWRIEGESQWDEVPEQKILEVPTSLKDGFYQLEIKVTDVAGNEAVKSVRFQLDKTPPVIENVYLRHTDDPTQAEIDEGDYVSGESVFVSIKAEDGLKVEEQDSIKEYRYLLTRQWLENPDFTKAQVSAEKSFIAEKLENGIMYLYLKAIDHAGNESSSFIKTIKIDKKGCVAPQIIGLTHPRAEKVEDAVAQKEAVFSLIPGKSGVSGVKGYQYQLWRGEELFEEGDINDLKLVFEDLEDNLIDEYYLLKVCAVSGNRIKSEWAQYRFRVDTRPPQKLKIFSPTHGNPDVWYSYPSAVIQWQKPLDFTGVKYYYYKAGTSPYDAGILTEDLKKSPLLTQTKQTAVTLDLKKIANEGSGTVYFTLWAEDFAGNQQMDVREIRFDTISPVFGQVDGHETDLLILPHREDRSANVSWGTPADNIKISHMELGIREYDDTKYHWRIKGEEETCENFQDLKEGTTYVVCLKVLDVAGNSRSLSWVFDLDGVKEIETSAPFSATPGGYSVYGTLYSGSTPHEAILEIPESCDFTGGNKLLLENVQADDQGFLCGESSVEYNINLNGFKVSGKGLSISRDKGLVLKSVTYISHTISKEDQVFSYKNVTVCAPPAMLPLDCEAFEGDEFDYQTVNSEKDTIVDGFIIRNITTTGFENGFWVFYKGQLDLSFMRGFRDAGDSEFLESKFLLRPNGILSENNSEEVFHIKVGDIDVKACEWRLESDRIIIVKGVAEFLDGFLSSGNEVELQNFSFASNGGVFKEEDFKSCEFSFVDGPYKFNVSKVDFDNENRIVASGSIVMEDGRECIFENAVLTDSGIDDTVPFYIKDFESEIHGFTFQGKEGVVIGNTIEFEEITGEFPNFLGGERVFKNLIIDKYNYDRIVGSGLCEGFFEADTGFGSKVTLGKIAIEDDGIRTDGIVVRLPQFMGGKEHRFGDMLLTVEGLCPVVPEDFDFNIGGFSIHGRGATFDFDRIKFEALEIECPDSFGTECITLYDIEAGPDGFLCEGTSELEMEYSYDGWKFILSRVSLDENGLICDGKLMMSGKLLDGVLEVKDIRINSDGSFRGVKVEGSFGVKLYGMEAQIHNISLSPHGLCLDADISGEVLKDRKLSARGLVIKSDGSLNGRLTVPVDLSFTASNGYSIRANQVIFTEEDIRLKGMVSLPGCMESGKSLQFTDVELILHADGRIEASGILQREVLTIGEFTVTAENIHLGTEGVTVEKALLDILSPGYTLEFENLSLDTSGNLTGVVTVENVSEFQRSGWNFNIKKLILSSEGLVGDFDIRLPDELGGDCIGFENTSFLPQAPYIKMNMMLEKLAFYMGEVLFELRNVDFSMKEISAKSGQVSFRVAGEPKVIQLPALKISSDGSIQIDAVTLPPFDLWGHEIFISALGISDEKLEMKGWLNIEDTFGIKELAGKRVDINSLIINKKAEIEDFECSYKGGISFNVSTGIIGEIHELGIDEKGIAVKNGKLILSSHFPEFIKEKNLVINELVISHQGEIISIETGEMSFYGRDRENSVLGKMGIASGSVIVSKEDQEDDVKVVLKGSIVLSKEFPGGLGGTELLINSLIIDGNGRIQKIEASGDIPEDCVLEAGIRIRGGKISVVEDDSETWMLGITGKLKLPDSLPGDLAHTEIDLEKFFMYPNGIIETLEAKVKFNHEIALYGEVKIRNCFLELIKVEDKPLEINTQGTIVLPASAPGILSGREIQIQSLSFSTAGEIKEFIAKDTLEGEHTLSGGIRLKDPQISMYGQGDILVNGKLILPDKGSELFRNTELEIGKLVIDRSGNIKELNARLEKQGKYILAPGIEVVNPGIGIGHKDGCININVSGTFIMGDVLPDGLKGKVLDVDTLVFDSNGQILDMDITLKNINVTFFDCLEVLEGSMRLAGGGDRGEILFGIEGLIKLPASFPTGLGGRTLAIKECVISGKDGLRKFVIHDPKGRYFNLCGTGAQGRFYEAEIGAEGMGLTGEVVFNKDFIIEGFAGTTIALKKFMLGWNGEIKEIDASVAAIKKTFGGFTADIENFDFHKEGIHIGKLDIILPDNMGNKRFGIRDAGIRRDGSFYGKAVSPDISIGYGGFKLIFDSPMLDPGKKEISFKSVTLVCPDLVGKKEFGLNGVKIRSTGIVFTGGKFAIPNFTISNVLSFRDIKLDFIIDGNSFRVAGEGAAFIQGAGTLKAEIAFQNISSTYPIGIEYAEFTYTLVGKGIPIANTGLYMYEIRGGLGFGPPGNNVPRQIAQFLDSGIRIRLGASIRDGSTLGIIDGAGDIWIDVKDFQWALRAHVTVLSGMASGTAITMIDKDSFYTEVSIDIAFARGSAFIYVFRHKGGVAVSGGGKIQFGIREGAIWRAKRIKVFGKRIKLGPDIPWKDLWLISGGAEFGLFRKGSSDVKGVKGWVDVPLWGDVGVFVTRGDIDFTDISEYKVYKPGMASIFGGRENMFVEGQEGLFVTQKDSDRVTIVGELQKNNAGETYLVDVPGIDKYQRDISAMMAVSETSGLNTMDLEQQSNVERMVFVIGYLEGNPEVVIISPTGKEYRQGTDGVLTEHADNGMVMAVLNPEPGQWQVEVKNVPEGMYMVQAFGKTKTPKLNIETPVSENEEARGFYRVSGTYEDAKEGSDVIVYISEEKDSYVGKPVGNANIKKEGKFDVLVDTALIEDGRYYIYGALDMGEDQPRVMNYAKGSIVVDNLGVPLKKVENLIVSGNGESAIEVCFKDPNGYRAKGFKMYVRNTVSGEEEIIDLGYLTNISMPGYGEEELEVAVAPYDSNNLEGEKSSYIRISIKEEKKELNLFDVEGPEISFRAVMGENVNGSIKVKNSNPQITGTAYDFADGMVVKTTEEIQVTFGQEAVNITGGEAVIEYTAMVPEKTIPGEYTVKVEIQNRGNRGIKQEINMKIEVVYPEVKVESLMPEEWHCQENVELEIYGENFFDGTTVSLNGKILEVLKKDNMYMKVLVPAGTAQGKGVLTVTGPGGDSSSVEVDILKPEYSIIVYKNKAEIMKGSSSEYFFQLVGDNGFDSEVSFMVKEAPKGWNVNLKEQLKDGDMNAVLVNVPYEVEEGMYKVKIISQYGDEIILLVDVLSSNPKPYISSFYRMSVSEGDTLDIFGYGFDISSTVRLDGKKLDVVSCSKDHITVRIPMGSKSGNITVETLKIISNSLMLYVKNLGFDMYPQKENILLTDGEETDISVMIKGNEAQVSLGVKTSSEYIQAEFDRKTIVPNGEATLSIRAIKGTPSGIYRLRIEGKGSKNTVQKIIEVEVKGEKVQQRPEWYFKHSIIAGDDGIAHVELKDCKIGLERVMVTYRIDENGAKNCEMKKQDSSYMCDIGNIETGTFITYNFRYQYNGKWYDSQNYFYIHEKYGRPYAKTSFGIKQNSQGNATVWMKANQTQPNGNPVMGIRRKNSEYHPQMQKNNDVWEEKITGLKKGDRVEIRIFYNTSEGAFEIPWFEFTYNPEESGQIGESLERDELDPETSVKIDIIPEGYNSFKNGYYNRSPRIQIKAKDFTGRKIDSYYSINGSDIIPAQGEIRLKDGENRIETYVLYKGTMLERDKITVIKIDNSLPWTQHHLSGNMSGINTYNNAVVTLEADDAGSGVEYIEYSLDGVKWHCYREPVILNRDGNYNIRYRAVDLAGNYSHEKQTGGITVKSIKEGK